MAVGADHLFFTMVSSGAVKRSGKLPGTAATELFDVAADAGKSSIAKPIAADVSQVFVGTTQAGVRHAPVGGTASTAFNTNKSDTMLAINATHLAYVFDDIIAGKRKVIRIKKDGGGTYDLLHAATYGIGALSVGTDVFWANSNGNGTYNIQHKVGATVIDVVHDQPGLEGLYELGARLYWSVDISAGDGEFLIRSAALDGSARVDLITRARDTTYHYFLADSDGLYWVDLNEHGLSLFRATLEGANVREVAPSVGMLRTLASDGTHLYWLKQTGGQVYRLAK